MPNPPQVSVPPRPRAAPPIPAPAAPRPSPAPRRPGPGLELRRGWALLTPEPVPAIRRGCLALALAVALLNPITWSNVLPYGRGPDEPDHFDMVDFILTEGRLPVFGPAGDRWIHLSALGQPVESYAAYPLLTYLVAAPLAAWLPLEPFRAARLVSSLSVFVVALCTYLSARRLAPRTPFLYLGAPAVVALIPQLTFVGAYLNRDAFGAALASAVVALSVRGALGGWSLGLAAAAGAAVGLVGAANYPAYPVAVVPGLTLLAARAPWRSRLRWGLAAAAAGLLAGGWWFARNLRLYGEVMPERILREGMLAVAPDYPVATVDRGLDALTLLTRTRWLLDTFSSFWGVFDQQNLFLAPPLYGGLIALCAISAVGLLAWLIDGAVAWARRRVDRERAWLVVALLLFCLLTLLGSLWSSVVRDNSPQGRYLFPALVPIALGLVAGWRLAASALVRVVAWGGDDRLPTLGRAAAWAVLIVGLAWLNVYCLVAYVIPRYYGATADRVRVTVSAPERDQRLGAGERLLAEGWAIVERGVAWRPEYLVRPARWYAPVDAVRLFLDAAPGTGGVELGAARPVDREDVARRFGGDRRLGRTGYELAIDRPLPPGRHRLFVCAYGGGTAGRYCATVPFLVEAR